MSLPNPVGRPPMFSTPEELEQKIHDYFNGGLNNRKVVIGRPPNASIELIPCPTISGLAYYIGFASRQSFYDYEEKPEFTYTVKRARLFIEVEYEEQLQHGNTVGAIFALKNMGWRDKSEVEQTGESGVTIKVVRE